MAPEVISGQYTEKCDVWSLGVVVYFMLCGSLPFNSKHKNRTDWKLEIFAKARSGKVQFPKWASELSSDARKFVLRCLKVDPEKRPNAASMLGNCLRSATSTLRFKERTP